MASGSTADIEDVEVRHITDAAIHLGFFQLDEGIAFSVVDLGLAVVALAC
jgi:hypothetical protein